MKEAGMSQSPNESNEPNESNDQGSVPQPPREDRGAVPARDGGAAELTGAGAEPRTGAENEPSSPTVGEQTTPHPVQPQRMGAAPTDQYAVPPHSSDQASSAPYAAGSPQTNAEHNPYGHSVHHGSPQAPERKAGKRYAGSTLIAGMVAAALIGGVSAAGTSYFMTPDTGSDNHVQTPQSGLVINNPESVTAVTAAAAKAAPSVVTIEASGAGSAGSGSGIILDDEGHILTNTHVVTLGGATADPSLNVRLNDGKVYSAELVGTDPLSDLAVIKVDANNLVPATLGTSSDLNVGDAAVAIGAPLGLSGTVTDGIISTLNRTISVASSAVPDQPSEGEGNSEFNFEFPGMPQQQGGGEGSIFINVIQTDAAINHGNSGGALVDTQGEIIGVNVAIASSGSGGEDSGSIGVGFAIPIDYAKRIATELIENGQATHGLLGATVQAQAAGAEQQSSSSFSIGALIREISPGSAAEKAGLKAGDVITGVNGRPIQDSQTLTAAIREVPAGGTAQITYTRDSTSATADVVVGTLENN